MTLLGPLSPRQREVLGLIADGLTNASIARRLSVGLATAQRHVYDIRTKLGASNRAHAVALGYRTGQLTIDAREAS